MDQCCGWLCSRLAGQCVLLGSIAVLARELQFTDPALGMRLPHDPSSSLLMALHVAAHVTGLLPELGVFRCTGSAPDLPG